MSDMVVSVGLNIVEEQVLVRVLVAHEKPMMTNIPSRYLKMTVVIMVCFRHVCDVVRE